MNKAGIEHTPRVSGERKNKFKSRCKMAKKERDTGDPDDERVTE